MASYTTITLDTTGPAGVTASINSGDAYATSQDVSFAGGTSDGDTTGYQMKIWGSVDTSFNASIQATEGASSWISYSASQPVRLSTGDGVKTVNVRLRDDVWNESSSASDQITLDTSIPVVTIAVAPSPSKISKISGKRVSTFEWNVDVQFEEYKVKVVPATNSTHTAGTQIGTTNGSTNVSGTAGSYPSATNIVTDVRGEDLESASAGDGAKTVKVFVKDIAGNWST